MDYFKAEEEAEEVDQLAEDEDRSFAIIVDMLAIMHVIVQIQHDSPVGTINNLIMSWKIVLY